MELINKYENEDSINQSVMDRQSVAGYSGVQIIDDFS